MTAVSICIDVSDVDKATRFYAEVLACKIKTRKEGSAELETENSTIHLIQKEERSNPLPIGTAARDYTRHWTPVHLDFHVKDIDRAISLVPEFGGVLEGKQTGDWGVAAFCADPFGNGFCLINIH